jgi:hypothetical protein
MCLCIGPEKCGDTTCSIVRAYQRRQRCFKKKLKKMWGEDVKKEDNFVDALKLFISAYESKGEENE